VNSARLILFSLLATVPVVLLIDVPIMLGLIAAMLSAGLFVVASTIRDGEADFLLTSIRPIVGIAIVPAVWMVFQVLPLPAVGLAHPIWESAEQAMGQLISGSISIDPGASLLALVRYLSIFAIVLLAAAVAVNRTGAELVLFALVAVTALIAIAMIGQAVANFAAVDNGIGPERRVQARECVALGIVVSAASLIRTFERYETKHFHPERSSITLRRTFIACLVALALCVVALALDITGSLLFAVAYALGTLLAVIAIRRFGLGPSGSIAIAAVAAMIVVIVITSRLATHGADLTLALVSDQPEAMVSTTQRMLADAPWAGTGAGTFASLLPIYREADFVTDPTAPTTASKIALELGHPMFWIIVVLVAIGIALLLRGAMLRGRDSFYPAAGASSLLLLLILSFCENGVLSTPVSICTAAIAGLAFAQCKSRAL
jgi:hypothetical protein